MRGSGNLNGTMAETGFPDFVLSSWMGLFGPAGLPSDIRQQLGIDRTGIKLNPRRYASEWSTGLGSDEEKGHLLPRPAVLRHRPPQFRSVPISSLAAFLPQSAFF